MASPSPALPTERQKSVWDSVEQLVKVGTGLLALIYAAGFLAVSIHHARYGIVMFEFLRARVFAAGTLLAIFVGLPILTVWSSIFLFSRMKAVRNRRTWFVVSVHYVFMAAVWMLVLSPWMGGVVRPYEIVWWIPLSQHPVPLLAAWFLIISALFGLFYRAMRNRRFQADDWTVLSPLGALALVGFAAWIYGNVSPSWGGGLPMPVTVHLCHKTAFSDSADVPAYLVDETERGYYLIHKLDDHKASFLPREAIASVDFEEIKKGQKE